MWFKNRRAKWRKQKREEEARKRTSEPASGNEAARSADQTPSHNESEESRVLEDEISVTDDEDDIDNTKSTIRPNTSGQVDTEDELSDSDIEPSDHITSPKMPSPKSSHMKSYIVSSTYSSSTHTSDNPDTKQ